MNIDFNPEDLLIDPPFQDENGNVLLTKLAPYARLISKEGNETFPIHVRDLVTWSGYRRRKGGAEQLIEDALNTLDLITTPNFRDSHINSEVILSKKTKAETSIEVEPPPTIPIISVTNAKDRSGHILTVGRLEAANRSIVSVSRSAPIQEATTLMWKHNFSQIPVMQNERTVLGMVTWQSITRWTIANGKLPNSVDDCLERHTTVEINENLLTVMPTIIESQSVLVRGLDKKFTGIITSSDLSYQFREISEAFITIGQIEAILRIIIENYYPLEVIKKAKNPLDEKREINSVDNLAFGEYKRLFENEEDWNTHFKINISRSIFIATLEEIRVIRNDVMHFDPDGVEKNDLRTLSTALRFFDSVKDLVLKNQISLFSSIDKAS